MIAVYNVINRSDAKGGFTSRDPAKVSSYFLGRRYSNYIIVKSDEERGDRLVDLSKSDGSVEKITKILQEA